MINNKQAHALKNLRDGLRPLVAGVRMSVLEQRGLAHWDGWNWNVTKAGLEELHQWEMDNWQ